MDSITFLIISGILSSVFVFGIKSGIGCGFSRIGKAAVAGLCLLYLIISTVAGYFMNLFDVTSFLSSSLATSIHIVLAVFLLAGGIATIKKWNQGCDISGKTFFILAFPCPVCLSALMLSSAALSTVIDMSGTFIGFLVGLVFVLSIVLSSFFFRNIGKVCRKIGIPFDGTPEALGSVMIFIGLFYLTAAIMIPAYIRAGDMPALSVSVFGTGEIFSYLLAALLIIIGALTGSMAAGKKQDFK